jgi:hypothetical protein
VIERDEVISIMFLLADIRLELREIRLLLSEDDGEETSEP